MRDPKWIGTSPTSPGWSAGGKYLCFNWNPEKAISDSLYFISLENKNPQKASPDQKNKFVIDDDVQYNFARTLFTYSKNGDIYLVDAKSNQSKRITQTQEPESNPVFSFNDTKIVYSRNQNLYAWDISNGTTLQLTNLQKGNKPPDENSVKLNSQEDWLKQDQLQWMQVLKSRKEKKDAADKYEKSQKNELRSIYFEDKNLSSLSISPDGRFITYRLVKPAKDAKNTIIPAYVTESGFTQDLSGRTKVGSPLSNSDFFIYDRAGDTVIQVKTDSIPGIRDIPEYIKDYPKKYEERKKNNAAKIVSVFGPIWSDHGKNAIVDIRSQDNKDRWLMLLDPATGKLKLMDHQHDEAWIGGPGIFNMGWIDEDHFWFQSEATGYSHLYSVNVGTAVKTAITSGNYEIQQATLSHTKKYFYVITNEVHPGEQQFYRLSVTGSKAERITTMEGANQVSVSPDEKYIAILYSYYNKPWELYLQENKPGGKLEQITNRAMSDEFKSYAWRVPELLTITASDGARVYARLYKPANPVPNAPAVIFVHGAGYLQNAHKWWSSYFREYMFNNLLTDNGYYVLDMDYRGSAGYGRDWRTGIYRYMGGKDLSDQVDGAKFLVDKYKVNPDHIGMYGGSYGGFITLMAMFTKPGTIAAGAALRPVTDWAHYNHGYTSDILNTPVEDSIAYRRSSPIYFAEGLKGSLLICHGMMDLNVHFQDVVRLSQRLIELGKNDWELAPFPMEDHGFIEPSSWTDEYKRIFKLFQTHLK